MSLIKLFHSPSFSRVDPLGDGLAEEINAEQTDPDSLAFQTELDAHTLEETWQKAIDDLHNDPSWFTFDDE